ncbi:MAG: Na+/H+ antiporter subunit E [Chloroflexi bacterium]|nr:Na+/H+ antiporter subunit E [Chloroflexota bacterium]
MTTFLLNMLLALAWIALTGTFTPVNFAVGFVVGFVLLWLTQRLIVPSNYFRKVPQVIGFGLFFLWELVKANLRMMAIVLSPRPDIRPAVVAIPLDARSNIEITLLANLITLTPGTLYLDVSQDRCVMYVHTMHVADLDAFRESIKAGFERRVMEVLR